MYDYPSILFHFLQQSADYFPGGIKVIGDLLVR